MKIERCILGMKMDKLIISPKNTNFINTMCCIKELDFSKPKPQIIIGPHVFIESAKIQDTAKLEIKAIEINTTIY
jgi:hypothetical protein